MKVKPRQKRRWRLLALCYGAVLLVWLVVCGVQLLADTLRQNGGGMARQVLAPQDFAPTTSGISFSDNWATSPVFSTTDADPQLHLDFDGGAHVGRFVFRATALNKPGGEMALYYTTRPGQDFSEAKKLPARKTADGGWLFDLQGKKVYRLRLDPDSVGGVWWRVDEIVLNEAKPIGAYFTPDALQWAVLLFLPVGLYGLIGEANAYLQPALTKRRLERRWRQNGTAARPRRGKKTAGDGEE